MGLFSFGGNTQQDADDEQTPVRPRRSRAPEEEPMDPMLPEHYLPAWLLRSGYRDRACTCRRTGARRLGGCRRRWRQRHRAGIHGRRFIARRDLNSDVLRNRSRLGIKNHRQPNYRRQYQGGRPYQSAPGTLFFRQHRIHRLFFRRSATPWSNRRLLVVSVLLCVTTE